MRKGLRIALALSGLIFTLFTVGFVRWGQTSAQPMPEVLTALQSDAQVTVSSGAWLVFTPAASQPTTGFIIYPGGRVDYRAYAPAAYQIAAKGYLVVIPRMPLNLAVFGVSEAKNVITAYPQVQNWAIGGHSLGGAMAANFAINHSETVQGLVLWAAYPASSDDLSDSGLRAVSITGSLDGLATGEKIEASRSLLPADTKWVLIAGANHAQFGWYGEQDGDNPAVISRSDQQAQIVAATISLLEGLK